MSSIKCTLELSRYFCALPEKQLLPPYFSAETRADTVLLQRLRYCTCAISVNGLYDKEKSDMLRYQMDNL